MEYPIIVVCLLGMGIVFLGLICLVGIIQLTGYICRERPEAVSPVAVPADTASDYLLDVAITAALAEVLRVEYDEIRIVSISRHKEAA